MHTYMHTYIHTHIHTYIHTHTHAHTHTRKHKHTHTQDPEWEETVVFYMSDFTPEERGFTQQRVANVLLTSDHLQVAVLLMCC